MMKYSMRRIKKYNSLIFVFILLNCPITTNAQILPRTRPEDVGLSSTKLERINLLIQRHVDNGELPGAVTLIGRHGKIAHFEAFGYADVETKQRMPRNGIFRIASMAKIFTTVAVMILYEEGHFSLNDPVSSYIPELTDMEVVDWPDKRPQDGPIATLPSKRQMTIRDLLRHTAGFSYGHDYFGLDKMYEEAGINPRYPIPWEGTLHEFIKEIAQLPLAYPPGTMWIYSYATDILGYLIEVITSMPQDQFLRERIYRPLGLNDTGFTISENDFDRFPNLYRFENNDLLLLDVAEFSEFMQNPSAFSGGGGWTSSGYGGLISTAMDFAKILQLLLNEGQLDGKRVLSRKTVELMLQDHLNGISNNWLGPGVGFNLVSAVLKDVGADGDVGSRGMIWWAGSCNTYYFMDPVEDMFGILMTQIRPFGHLGLMGKFKRFCMHAIDD